MKYDAYLSYSRRVDRHFAHALLDALSRFDTPFWPRRSNRIFSDLLGTDAGADLPKTVRLALKESKHFILLASPAAAHSQFIEEELSLWLDSRPIENLIIVLTDGEMIPGATSSLPPILEKRANRDSLPFIDLRWAQEVESFERRYQFTDAVAEISAVLQGVSKDTLLNRQASRNARLKRLSLATTIGLIVLSLSLMLAGSYAVRQASKAREAEARLNEAHQIAERATDMADKERKVAATHAVEANELQRRVLMLQQEVHQLRRQGAVIQTSVAQARIVELEDSLANAEIDAAAFQQQLEEKNKLAADYKAQYESAIRLAQLNQQLPSQTNSYLREFIRQNLTLVISAVILAVIIILFSTRLVLLLLQLDIVLLRPLAIGFFYTPLGRWKLYRKYKKRLGADATIHYHSQHYIDLPYETSDNGGSSRPLEAFLEDSMKSHNVCIVAGGGQGKTTLAYKLALQSIHGQLPIDNKNLIPVVVDGLTYDGNLLEAITATLKQQRVYANTAIVGSQIAAGNILVILDGWSEVREFYSEPEESSDIPKFISNNPDTRFIFTSRSDLPASIRHSLGDVATIKLKDLDEQTLDEFLGKYINRPREQVESLARELKESSNEIPQTPLMIRMVAEIYDKTGEIPRDRITLFAQYVEKLLRPDIIHRMDKAGLLYVLKHLVRNTYVATDGDRGFPIHKGIELIDEIKVMVGNFGIRLLPIDLLNLFSHAGLYRRSGEYLRFSHDSFESYFAARLLDDDFRDGKYVLIAHCAASVRFIETMGFLLSICNERNEQQKLVDVIREARLKSGVAMDVIA